MPFTPTEFGPFCLGALALVMSPGADFFYVITRGISGGPVSGWLSALGIATGLIAHTVLASSGLSLLVLTSSTGFLIVKWAGVAYLLWMGINMLRSRDALLPTEVVAAARPGVVFRQGVLTNVLNPKAALTFAAFLPPFVHPDRGGATLQIALLGTTLCVLALTWFTLVGTFAGKFGALLARHPRFSTGVRIGSGVTLAILGVRLATVQKY